MANGPPLSFNDDLGTLSPFTPPATCLERITSLSDPRAGQGEGKDRTYFVGMIGNDVDKTCYPPSYTTDVFYPTGACPSGWTSACAPSYTVVVSDSVITLPMFPTGFPAAQCCPSGFNCYDAYFCRSAAPPSQVTALLLPQSTIAPITIDRGDIVWAKPIFVKTGKVAVATTFFSNTEMPRPSTTPTDCGAMAPSNVPEGLSTETKIALAAVIPVTVFALLVGGLWFFCARRRMSKDLREKSVDPGRVAYPLPDEDQTSNKILSMGETPHYAELHNHTTLRELMGSSVPRATDARLP